MNLNGNRFLVTYGSSVCIFTCCDGIHLIKTFPSIIGMNLSLTELEPVKVLVEVGNHLFRCNQFLGVYHG